MKELNRRCPLCDCKYGDILKHIHMIAPTKISIPSSYDVVTCIECGFCFADVDATQRDYNCYYEKQNMYSRSGLLKSTELEKICEMRYSIFEKFIDRNKRIVDVGCGDGSFLAFLKERGYKNLFGIDPSAESVESLKKKGIEGYVGNIFGEIRANLKENFDVVVCTEVLEHIYALNEAISKLQIYLKDKGILFVDVPAVEGFVNNLLPMANYFNCEHINYFGIHTLDNFVGKFRFRRMNSTVDSYGKIVTNNGKEELCLMGMYQKQENKIGCVIDTESQKSIRNYFAKIDKKNKDLAIKINALLQQHNSWIIWGTGNYMSQLLAEFPELQRHIVCFIDNNVIKQGLELENKKIYPPNILLKQEKKHPIFICSMMNSGDIVNQIKQMKIENMYYVLS